MHTQNDTTWFIRTHANSRLGQRVEWQSVVGGEWKWIMEIKGNIYWYIIIYLQARGSHGPVMTMIHEQRIQNGSVLLLSWEERWMRGEKEGKEIKEKEGREEKKQNIKPVPLFPKQ